MASIVYIILIYLSDMHNKQIDITSHLSPQLSQLRSLINIAQNRYNTTVRLLPLDLQASQLEPLEINIEIQQAVRDTNINIGDPDYNHNIDILLRGIIDRANLRRLTTSSTTIDHQLLHLHQSGSASTSTTYLPQQQEEIDIGIIGTIYSLEPTQPLCTSCTSSTTAPVRQQQLQLEHRQQHHNISMINNIESPEDAHQEEFDNNNPYILQSMRIIYYNNNMETWTGTIIDHNIFSTSLRQLQLHPQSDEPNIYINNIGSDINIILFIIHDTFICISKTDLQQEIINNIAPEGAQLINIELDNINFIDNISADIINLTYLDLIQQPHLQ